MLLFPYNRKPKSHRRVLAPPQQFLQDFPLLCLKKHISHRFHILHKERSSQLQYSFLNQQHMLYKLALLILLCNMAALLWLLAHFHFTICHRLPINIISLVSKIIITHVDFPFKLVHFLFLVKQNTNILSSIIQYAVD